MKPDRESVRNRKLFLLARAKQTLEQAGVERPDSESELLLAAALGIDRARLHTGSFCFDDYAIARFDGFIARRASREPLAYIVGHKEFYSLEFEVTRDVLIPRPETELLAATALLEVLRKKPRATVLDIGTGSGAIAITIALKAPAARVVATDISAAALAVARRNAQRLGCAGRIEFAAGDGFAALTCSHPKFDLIVSNPPYIPADELARLEPEVARFEPGGGFVGRGDGLEFYRRIAREVGAHLIGGGEVMVEVGAGQAGQVADLLEESGCRALKCFRDLSGHERVVHARRAGLIGTGAHRGQNRYSWRRAVVRRGNSKRQQECHLADHDRDAADRRAGGNPQRAAAARYQHRADPAQSTGSGRPLAGRPYLGVVRGADQVARGSLRAGQNDARLLLRTGTLAGAIGAGAGLHARRMRDRGASGQSAYQGYPRCWAPGLPCATAMSKRMPTG